jgi:outer membrane protein TolC
MCHFLQRLPTLALCALFAVANSRGDAQTLPPAGGTPSDKGGVILPPKMVPISLDTVMRLARDNNGQMKLAREKLNEAFLRQDLAHKKWLPDLTIGPSYYRHEGGIQDFQGNLINSSYGSTFGGIELRGKLDLRDWAYQKVDAYRSVLQRHGEVSQLAGEQLVDAVGTYLDVLATRSAIALAQDTGKQLADLQLRTEKLAKIDSGMHIEVVRVEAELGGQKVAIRKLTEGMRRAEARLLYLLQIDPECELLFLDTNLTPFQLVDTATPPGVLVDQALKNGPGVQEMAALLDKLYECQRKAAYENLLPTVEMTVGEGLFGAGPGNRMDFTNRMDMGVHARWNLTNWHLRGDNERVRQSQISQAQLALTDLKGKLILGVRESLESIQSSQDQIALALINLEKAEQNYKLSESRFQQNIKGASASEVLLALRTLSAAKIAYLHAIRDLDKGQIRLFAIVGGVRK